MTLSSKLSTRSKLYLRVLLSGKTYQISTKKDISSSPQPRAMESQYNPDNTSLNEKRVKLDEVKKAAELTLSKFFVSLPRSEQLILRNHSEIPHLCDLQIATLY